MKCLCGVGILKNLITAETLDISDRSNRLYKLTKAQTLLKLKDEN